MPAFDLALGLRTPVDQAEAIKIQHGCAIQRPGFRDETIDVPGVGGRVSRKLSKAYITDIIQPRMEEILTLAYREIKKSKYVHLMTAGLVITGGGSMLDGTVELAEEIFDMGVKQGVPNGFSGLTDLAQSPIHATGVGLVHYGLKNKFEGDELFGKTDHGLLPWIVGTMQKWFSGVHRY